MEALDFVSTIATITDFVSITPNLATFINTHLAVNLIWRRDQPSKALKIHRQMQYVYSIVSSFAWFPPDYAMRQKWLRLVKPILSGLQSEICLVCLDDIADKPRDHFPY